MATKDNQSLVRLVKDLQKLNKVKADLPKSAIKSIIKDPKQFALDFGELIFVRNLVKYKKAYDHGIKFAKTNLKNENTLNVKTENKD